MNTITFLFIAAFGLLLAAFAALLSIAIAFNIKAGMKYRNKLAQQVNDLRLSRMMRALGINIETYLHSEQGLDIKKQIERCAGCNNTQTCDEQLTQAEVSPDNIDYCTNRDDLRHVVNKQQTVDSSSTST